MEVYVLKHKSQILVGSYRDGDAAYLPTIPGSDDEKQLA